jgi:hypothetical protein
VLPPFPPQLTPTVEFHSHPTQPETALPRLRRVLPSAVASRRVCAGHWQITLIKQEQRQAAPPPPPQRPSRVPHQAQAASDRGTPRLSNQSLPRRARPHCPMASSTKGVFSSRGEKCYVSQCFMGCQKKCSDINKKINYITCLETARRIY